jgi:hypothetical protein
MQEPPAIAHTFVVVLVEPPRLAPSFSSAAFPSISRIFEAGLLPAMRKHQLTPEAQLFSSYSYGCKKRGLYRHAY